MFGLLHFFSYWAFKQMCAIAESFKKITIIKVSIYIQLSIFIDCDYVADINFIIDSSTSAGSFHFQKMKRLAVKVSRAFRVGEQLSHYSMVHYSYWAVKDFTFAERQYWTKNKLESKIMASNMLYGKHIFPEIIF